MSRRAAAALLLLSLLPLAPTHATDRRAAAVERWLADDVLLARRLGVPDAQRVAIRKGVADDEYAAFLEQVGDLDRDGGPDFVDVQSHAQYDPVLDTMQAATRVVARRGRDGRKLWAKEFPSAESTFVLPVRVGNDGRPGVAVVYFTARRVVVAGQAGAGTATSGVRTFDGSGKTVVDASWDTHANAVTIQTGGGGFGYRVSGLFEAEPGKATDFLVENSAEAFTITGGAGVARFAVVNGATGAVREIGGPVGGAGEVISTTTKDLDGDRRDDFVAFAGSRITARRSSDGTALWDVPGGDWGYVSPLPDLTGDGKPEVDVMVAGGPATGSDRRGVLDGATGRTLFDYSGFLVPVGDADGRRGAEVVVESPDFEAGGSRMTQLTGSGRKRWSVVPAKTPKNEWYTIDVVAGDVNADGVADLSYRYRTLERSRVTASGTIDGRTGRVRRDARPGPLGLPVALDGRGTDRVTTAFSGGYLTLTAWRGDTGRRLWQSRVRVPDATDLSWQYGASAGRDRCGDVVVSLSGAASVTDVVFSGATGRPLWSLSRESGSDGDVRVAPPATVSGVRSC